MTRAVLKGFAVAKKVIGHKGSSSLHRTTAIPDATNMDQKIKDYFHRANR